MSISLNVQACLDEFQNQPNKADVRLQNELGRFRVWYGNVAAHQPSSSRRPLEYRLRDSSNLREAVLSLLQDLKDALRNAREASSPDQAKDVQSLARLSLAEALEDDDEVFDISDDEDALPPFTSALEGVHEVVKNLLRFSMALRHPAQHDRMRMGHVSTATSYEPNDIAHVQAKFPDAPSIVAQRLGKGISQNRQYFRYREEHHRKLQAGLRDGPGLANEESTVATSLPHETGGQQQYHSGAETNYTATSYTQSVDGQDLLRPPAWPQEGKEGVPFECPICFSIITADTERSWKQHVFEDLPPYICTSPRCETAVKAFSRRRDWIHHEESMHNSTWSCPFACTTSLVTSEVFEEHLRRSHANDVNEASIQSMARACMQCREDTTEVKCRLCKNTYPSRKLLYKHTGHHLEQLAFFALPKSAMQTQS